MSTSKPEQISSRGLRKLTTTAPSRIVTSVCGHDGASSFGSMQLSRQCRRSDVVSSLMLTYPHKIKNPDICVATL